MKTIIFFLAFVFGVIANSFSQMSFKLNNLTQNIQHSSPLDYNAYITESNAWDITDTVYANYGDSLEWRSFQDINNSLNVTVKIYKKSIWDQLSGNKYQSGQFVARYDNKYIDTIMLTNNPETNIYNPNNYIFENNTSYIICISNGGYMKNIQLTVGIDPNASISTIDESITIKAYPNPTKNFITLENSNYQNNTAFIYNQFGELIESILLENKNQIFDFSKYLTGVYILQIEDQRMKIVKE